MGIQTMSAQGGGVGGGGQPQAQSLSSQGSLYSLTLNEVQNHLGEPLNSMNLDELLKNVFPGEVSQSGVGEVGGTSSQYAPASGLQRQGSVTMPRALSKKTVDEVWREIQNGELKSSEEPMLGQEKQMTLGEMTLEDFLMKAGIVEEDSDRNEDNPMGAPQGSSQGVHWLQPCHQISSMDHHHQQGKRNLRGSYLPGYSVPHPMDVGVSPILDTMFPDGQMNLSSPTVGPTLSDPQTPGRKRAASGEIEIVEKLVERRQKRMIKNRESAARSRARKQAYTHELENKVSHLEEENERLKTQKKLDEILCLPTPEPMYQLRRTSSASF